MPIIAYKEKLKINDYAENICLAFDCVYDSNNRLKLRNKIDNSDYFDCGDYRIKIQDAIKKFDYQKLIKYETKNKGVRFLAILNYFVDEIPSIYSIKFESDSNLSIYYTNEIVEK